MKKSRRFTIVIIHYFCVIRRVSPTPSAHVLTRKILTFESARATKKKTRRVQNRYGIDYPSRKTDRKTHTHWLTSERPTRAWKKNDEIIWAGRGIKWFFLPERSVSLHGDSKRRLRITCRGGKRSRSLVQNQDRGPVDLAQRGNRPIAVKTIYHHYPAIVVCYGHLHSVRLFVAIIVVKFLKQIKQTDSW